MKKQKAYYLSTIIVLWLCLFSCQIKENDARPVISFQKPAHFPDPVYNQERNPVTTEGFLLGKKLFYDDILSRDGTVSCGSCHAQNSAFTQHGHDLSHGIDDRLTMRNAQPIMNLAWNPNFFWDGGVFDLDLFAPNPIEHPSEMGEKMSNVLQKLRNHEEYPQLFEKAFGTKEINTARFLMALSQFQLMCISANSKYDKVLLGDAEFTIREKAGQKIFEKKCATCHSGVLFTNYKFINNGLKVRNKKDTGRERITLDETDAYKFRVPSLRNLKYTKPYMHDGRFRNLEMVLDHYAKSVIDSPTLSPKLKQNNRLGIPLSEQEKKDIIEFLHTLSDTTFIKNKLLSEF